MIVSFAGTRQALTGSQGRSLYLVLSRLVVLEAHHRDGVGADEDFHGLVRSMDFPTHVVIHPPDDDDRAFLPGDSAWNSFPRLVLDNHLVEVCDLLLAAPANMAGPTPAHKEEPWDVVERAQDSGKQVYLFWPDGSVTDVTQR